MEKSMWRAVQAEGIVCKGPVVRHVSVMCWDGSKGLSGWTAGAEAEKVGRVQIMLG